MKKLYLILKNNLISILNYILPNRCIACREFTAENVGICSKCFVNLDFIAKPYCLKCGVPFEFKLPNQALCGNCISKDRPYILSRSLLRFNDSSRKLIHSFKYHDAIEHAEIFAKMILSRYGNDFADVDIIVPVPMNRFKRIFRKYNPPQILAQGLAKKMQVRMIPDLLIKTKWTKAQTKLTKTEREKNLQGSIIFNKKYNSEFSNRMTTILLVDDVRTTGTTCTNCIKVLKANKLHNIKFITIGST